MFYRKIIPVFLIFKQEDKKNNNLFPFSFSKKTMDWKREGRRKEIGRRILFPPGRIAVTRSASPGPGGPFAGCDRQRDFREREESSFFCSARVFLSQKTPLT